METIINRLEALGAELRNKQVVNNELLANAHTDIMRNYLGGKLQALVETQLEVDSIIRLAKQTA